MREHGALKGLAVDVRHAAALEEVEAVDIRRVVADDDLVLRLFEQHDGLEEIAATVLNILAHRMQVGREDHGRREQALTVLALALAVELLPPLVHQRVGRLVADHDFGALALVVENIADRRVLVAVVLLEIRVAVRRLRLSGARHQRVDVRACDGDRQQADCGEDRVTAAHVVRNDEGLVALFVREVLQRAARLIGRAEDALSGLFLAVLLLEDLAEHAERDRRLRRGAGLRDHIDRNIAALADLYELRQRGGGDAVAGEVDVRRILLQRIVVFALQKLDRRAGAEVRAADADDDENIRILLDALGRSLDAREFFLVIIGRERHPAEKIIAGTLAGFQQLMRTFHLRCDRLILVILNKSFQISAFQF